MVSLVPGRTRRSSRDTDREQWSQREGHSRRFRLAIPAELAVAGDADVFVLLICISPFWAMGYDREIARKSASQFLKRTRDPRLSMLRKFADAIGVPLTDLLK
jgi:hypothetical protein